MLLNNRPGQSGLLNGISGVKVEVFYQESPTASWDKLDCKESGLLGTFTNTDGAFKLVVETDRGDSPRFLSFLVDGRKNLVPRRSRTDTTTYLRFVQRMQIQVTKSQENPEHFINYAENNIRLVQIAGCELKMFEISIISQNDKFFLTIQQTYGFRCYRDRTQVRIPAFDTKWPQLVEFLRPYLEPDLEHLPPIADAADETGTVDAADLQDGQGVVVWFNVASGMGVIKTRNEDVRLHRSQIIVNNGDLRYLEKNQRVSIQRLDSIEHREGKRQTSFRFKAIGVQAV